MTISRNLSFLAEGVSSTGVLGATYGGTGQSSITTGDLLYGSASNTISKLAIGSTGTILRVVAGVPSWGTDYVGTVTSVAALTLGTTGTDLSSTVANGTTTPVITLNVPTASATNRGVLSSADWTTFNNKGSGSVTSVAATVPSFLSISGSPITTSGTLAITYSGTALPVANGGTNATSAGITAFNNITGYSATGASGTTSTKLVFSDTPVFSGVTYMGSATGQNSVFNAVVGNTGANSGLVIVSSSTGTGWLGFNNANNASIPGQFTYNFNTGTMNLFSSGVITFNTNASGTVAAEIFTSGGVSIGNTTDPGATNLSVTGTGKFGTTVGVGAATPSASGAGITFPATQSASTNANTLDDYEEGTWTPTITGATTAGTGVYVLQQGSYTKIGNQVTVWFRILWSAHTGTGSTVLTGLPFTINASNVSFDFIPIASQSVAYTSGKTLVAGWGATGLTYTGFDIGQVGASSVYVVLAMATTGDLFGSVTYFV